MVVKTLNSEELLKKEIEYWSKHQEIDKFNYSMAYSTLVTSLAVIISACLSLTSLIFSLNLNISNRFFYTFIILSVFFYLIYKASSNFNKKNESIKSSHRIKEAMIRVRYQKLGVDTEKLGRQYEELKKIADTSSFNRELEEMARQQISK